MALQEGQVARTVRPLRPEGQAVTWRPGQDVVLNGREASSHYCCPFHVTLCGKTLRAGTYGRLSPVPRQAERSWALRHSMAQLVASPSVQGPGAPLSLGHILGDAPPMRPFGPWDTQA